MLPDNTRAGKDQILPKEAIISQPCSKVASICAYVSRSRLITNGLSRDATVATGQYHVYPVTRENRR